MAEPKTVRSHADISSEIPLAYGGNLKLHLYRSKNHYILRPVRNYSTVLYCNRENATLRVEDAKTLEDVDHQRCGIVYGIIGVMELFSGYKLLLVKKCSEICDIWGDTIYRIEDVAIIDLDIPQRADVLLEDGIVKKEEEVSKVATPDDEVTELLEQKTIKETMDLFQNGNFYFSHSGAFLFHLKERAQHLANRAARSESATEYFWTYETQFFWNRWMLVDLVSNKDYHPWVLPVMQGYVNATFEELSSKACEIILISRRSTNRAGTRFKKRGVDEDGNVANFVETEQILVYKSSLYSYLIIRGSVPIYWGQNPKKLQRKTRPSLTKPLSDSAVSMKKHFDGIIERYGGIHSLNLLNHHGSETVVGNGFTKLLDEQDRKHNSFDFHKHVKGRCFDNVMLLIKDVLPILLSQVYTEVNSHHATGQISQTQQGVFRVNCMDCLDRTNVVESFLSKTVLLNLLRQLELHEQDELPAKVTAAFNRLWTYNGDAVSFQYSGTNALKREVTLTGQGSILGALSDGKSSLYRMFRHTYYDTFRQHSIDLMLGKTNASEIRASETHNAKLREKQLTELRSRVTNRFLDGNDELLVGCWPVFQEDGGLRLEALLVLTHHLLFLVYCDFKTGAIFSYITINISMIHQVAFGLLLKREMMQVNMKPRSTEREPALRIFLDLPGDLQPFRDPEVEGDDQSDDEDEHEPEDMRNSIDEDHDHHDKDATSDIASSEEESDDDSDEEEASARRYTKTQAPTASQSRKSLLCETSSTSSVFCTLLPVVPTLQQQSRGLASETLDVIVAGFEAVREKLPAFTIVEHDRLPKTEFRIDKDDGTLLCGSVIKLGHVVKRWRKRWMILRKDGTLVYYKSQATYGQASPLNKMNMKTDCVGLIGWDDVISLSLANWPEDVLPHTGFAVRLRNGRPLYIVTSSKRLCLKWMNALKDLAKDNLKGGTEAFTDIVPSDGGLTPMLMSGYIVKLGGVVKNWKRRWMILRANGQLQYFKDRQASRPLKTIVLDRECVKIVLKDCKEDNVAHWPSSAPNPWGFALVTGKGRTFFMHADTHEEVEQWAKHVQPFVEKRAAAVAAEAVAAAASEAAPDKSS